MRKTEALLSFDNERLFYFALLLAVAPLWLAEYLPGIDLAGQVAQAAAFGEVWHGNPFLSGLFEINWATPYLTGTVLLYVLSLAMPIGVAVKLTLSAVIVATTILSGRLLEAVGGDARWKWLIIPSTYSFAFYWGFFPFLVAVPFGLAFLLLAIRMNQRPSVGWGIGVATCSLLLLVSHLLVLCFSSLLAVAWIIGANHGNRRRLATLSIPYAAPLPLIGLWLTSTQASGTYMSQDRLVFGPALARLHALVTQPSGLDGKFWLVSLAVTGVIIGMPYAVGAKLTKRPERWAMAVCGFATFMVFPSLAMGTAFLYERFGLFLPLLWFCLWDKPESATHRWHWVGMLAVLVWASVNTMRFAAFNVETSDFSKIMAVMEPGKRAASMVVIHGSRQFAGPVYLHFPSWYQAERRGVVDFNFGMFYVTIVRYKADKSPPYPDGLAWQPLRFQWDANDGAAYDYFIVRANIDVSDPIFKEHRQSVELVAQEGWWWLYKKVDTGT